MEQKLGEVIKNVEIRQEHLELIKEALRLSHNEEREYHEQMIGNLNAEYLRLQNRLDQAYLDKLDGNISEEFWKPKSEEWRTEQQSIREKIHLHESANVNYFDQGVKILELAHRAYSLYLRQDSFEKKKFIRFFTFELHHQ